MDKLADDVMAAVNSAVDHLTGEQIVEIGIGLLGKGLYRMSARDGKQEAANAASVASSVTTEMHIGFLRAAQAQKGAA